MNEMDIVKVSVFRFIWRTESPKNVCNIDEEVLEILIELDTKQSIVTIALNNYNFLPYYFYQNCSMTLHDVLVLFHEHETGRYSYE